jgi:hypothetical protein
MLSESARMSSAAEARFRVQAPNSRPRAITVIALDPAAEAVVRELEKSGWKNTTFLKATSPGATLALADFTGAARDLATVVEAADLLVFVAGPGGHADGAARVGLACSERRVMTTGFVVGAHGASEADLAKTLAQLRPWSLMVVISQDDHYIDDIMAALRA